MTREPGFYWVRVFEIAPPEIAFWGTDGWRFSGTAETDLGQEELDVLSERLVPPGDLEATGWERMTAKLSIVELTNLYLGTAGLRGYDVKVTIKQRRAKTAPKKVGRRQSRPPPQSPPPKPARTRGAPAGGSTPPSPPAPRASSRGGTRRSAARKP